MKETMQGINIRSLFSRNLKRLRTMANLSQMNLAANAGLTHNFINDIENGKKWVSPETIAKLATALRAEPYQFFLADPKWNNQGAEIFSLYLNDFQDSFEKMVDDYRNRFIPLNGEAGGWSGSSIQPPASGRKTKPKES
ncbi:MAG: helix-turn-helix domain-containing protein [Treponema sp.]|nr:helix-turn-helix domain-containing protein [Treponema sp.]